MCFQTWLFPSLRSSRRPDRARPARLLSLLLPALLWAAPALAEDFTFLQFSDVHAPVSGSRETIAAARDAGPVRMAPYNVTAGTPAFALVTGDLTEFGAGDGAWEKYRSYFEGFPFPVYQVPGNHDNTWWLLRPALRALHGSLPYSFDYGGCHFVGLDTAGRQDPRPGFCVEDLQWLRQDLAKVPAGTPLFLFFHHPLLGSEWASPYDYERLYAVLRPYDVALMMVGHGHVARAMKLGGYDAVEGGSTRDPKASPPSGGSAGYNVISVQGGVLRVAYRRVADPEALVGLLEKPLAGIAPLPEPRFLLPDAGAGVAGGEVQVALSFPSSPQTEGEIALDEAKAVPLTLVPGSEGAEGGARWEARLDLAAEPAGVHVLRAQFRVAGRPVYAAQEIRVERPGGPRALWRVPVGASVRGRPAISGGRVYVAAQDGSLLALEAATGRTLWRFRAGGEFLGGPALAGDTLYAASAEGILYAVDAAGQERWRYAGGAAFAAPPACSGDAVVVSAVDGSVHCVAQATGQVRWRSQAAAYTIETAACALGDALFVGSWDTFVHALSAADGKELWKAPSAGTERTAPRYYSPADCAPIVAGGRIFAADRNYKLTIIEAATGQRVAALAGCAAVAPAADGQGVYLRRPGNPRGLARVDLDGKEVWSTEVRLGYLASAPAEAGGVVAAASDTGLVSAVSASDGRLLWQYRVSAAGYLPGGALPVEGVVYAAGLDGSVTAVAGP